ncbi:MAG: type II secretion system GspH family protein [Candidatus Omnitrophica bacterium]|nr:type II secretion system GspH family protein [Candidatus Omnitrophota bacterium]
MSKQKGLTLLEILVSVLILALVMTALANIFVTAKRYILHSRLRMAGGELGRLFLDPLQQDVRQDQWGNNCLSANVNCPGAQTIDNTTYTPNYTITKNSPLTNLNEVSVTVSWNEPAP